MLDIVPRQEHGAEHFIGAVQVADKKPAPKKGRRAAREAQPSLAFDRSTYELPPLRLLTEHKKPRQTLNLSKDALEANARMLETVLADFGIKGTIGQVRPGPVVTLYELEPAAGVRSSRVVGLSDDIARSMSAVSARVAPVPGSNVIGIELPNQTRELVSLRELLSSSDFESSKSKLTMAKLVRCVHQGIVNAQAEKSGHPAGRRN